jgi:G3E family GTPase
LNYLLKQPGLSDTAVLINEFGDVSIDHDLVESIDDDIVVLNSGCVCCTVRGDLITALRDLWFKRVRGDIPEFRRVLIETTGLADPAPILHTLMTDPLISARYRLDGIITTVDAVNGLSQLDRQPEASKQAAVADRLILTKTDIADPEAVATLTERLRALNPAAPLIIALGGKVNPEAILDVGLFNPQTKHPDVARWLREEAYHSAPKPYAPKGDKATHSHDANRHDEHISSFALTFEKPLEWEGFISALELLIASKGPDLLRLKGIVNVAGQESPVVVHGVQHVFHPPVSLDHWPDGDHRTRIVFITRDISKEAVERLFQHVLAG